MSSSDIRDILQIGPSTEQPQRKYKQAEKRPGKFASNMFFENYRSFLLKISNIIEGISRELYSLIGGAPPVAFVKPTFNSKFQIKKKATPWVYRSFTNPARSDDLILKHWVKSTEADNQEYPFAKFNKVIDFINYTDEEYEKFLTDSDWSKDETDYLFELCRTYDLRFPVIEDRYNFESKPRTMEDLKDRYYSVCRKLILQGKGPSSSGEYMTDRQALAQQYGFDKAKEVERKNALIMLFNRTKEQVEEEEALFVEAKRIEMNEARLSKERESLLNSLHLEQIQQTASTPSTPINTASAMNSPGGAMLSLPGTINIASSSAGNGRTEKKKKSEEKKNRKLSNNTVPEVEVPEPKKEKLTPGVFVRSQKLPIVKTSMQPRVIKVLEELGIGPRPVMYSAAVCQRFETLQNSILTMFELKKVVDKVEVEHKVKVQKGVRDSTPTGRKRAGSTAGSASGREKRKK
ncbi:hypothetical protein BDF20DRAFT_707962 [Mycotypha africana]|uniref:uncharacterized protein n=1 Tax=Mycotypha africana TaxID=64632 RepID=UPI002300BF3B|nr:uncharacterized protein BDF20DRAFT_707962 [Mycotypha africana]KAI8971919.1 hypothetical protein BDF20DRAFT_707962 [Mycotypha africana]